MRNVCFDRYETRLSPQDFADRIKEWALADVGPGRLIPWLPVCFGLGIALLISGVVVTETVFAIPGLGRLTVDAILRRDYPVIQGVVLIFSASYVLVNLLIDISYTFFDPRIRY